MAMVAVAIFAGVTAEMVHVRSLAEWGVEAVMEAMPFVGIFALLLMLRAGTTRIVDRCFERHY
jgi:hypothetical protein